MPSIRLISLEFDENKFRKLSKVVIPIAERITIVAGHNGIGKSTILALLAHPSGITSRAGGSVSYFDNTFQANFNEIIHLDYLHDFQAKLGPPKTLAEPLVTYLINEQEVAAKACRLGPRPGPGKTKSARVVARSVKPTTKEFVSADGSITIGSDGKVPLPTIYLGMTRVLPVGEAQRGTASSTKKVMHRDDAKLIADFFNTIIPGSNVQAVITAQKIKNTGKVSGQPDHGFDARCVSLGQDSLGSIALALASFQMLQRTWADYPGGLLIIDEVDSGLHPHAIAGLVRELKGAARRLNLQVIATTHSPKLIEAVHPESEPKNQQPKDAVVYLRDRAAPKVLLNGTLRQILNDMSLVPPAPIKAPPRPVLKIYFEDDEAADVFSAVVPHQFLSALGRKYGVKISPMPLGVGCEHLARLADHDPYFNTVVMVLDADATVNRQRGKNDHIAQLPGDNYAAQLKGGENPDIVKKPLSPERTMLQWVLDVVNNPDEHVDTLVALVGKDVTTEHLLQYIVAGDATVLSKREKMKDWWKGVREHVLNWGLINIWAAERGNEVEKFKSDLERSISVVAKRLQDTAGQA